MDNACTQRKSYNSIDLVKFICSFLIITIHCAPFSSFNSEFDLFFVSTVSRIAVPFFFACSGFFFFSKLEYKNGKIINCRENRKRLYKYVGRIALLYIIWSAIYLLWQIPEWYYTGWLSLNAFIDYFISFFLKGSYYHMWYILDLIYATVFGYILLSLIKTKYITYIAAALYILGLLTYSYYWVGSATVEMINSLASVTKELWSSATRAFPLMFLGFAVGKSKRKISCKASFTLFLLSFICLVTEFWLLKKFTPNNETFSYIIFTVPCAVFLFYTVLNCGLFSNYNKDKFVLLRKSSTFIYCCHPMLINLFGLIPGFPDCNSLLKYLCVSAVSALIAFIIVRLSNYKHLRFLKYLY